MTPTKKSIALEIAQSLNLRVSARAHAQLSYIHTCASHMEEITGKFLHIYRSFYMLQIDPSGWKGSVSNGLGADISLPHCLATGIWNLAPKATSGPKSRGASFGTTLWRHVQRYCAQFLLFMVIYGNLVFGNIVEIVKNLYYRALEYFLDPRIISNDTIFKGCEKWPFPNILQRLYVIRQTCQKWPIWGIK